MKNGLMLIPTPIDEYGALSIKAFELLQSRCLEEDVIIAVEELKTARRRWLDFGLKREAIEKFVAFNEHTQQALAKDLVSQMQQGKSVFLMSDCGLPAFCDPGQGLVKLCHENNVKVSACPFDNSIALALALSGIDHSRFVFEGFLAARKEERSEEIKRVAKQKEVSIVMDTPYRMNKLVSELAQYCPERECFVGIDLNKQTELLLYGSTRSVLKKLPSEKREFVMVLGKQ